MAGKVCRDVLFAVVWSRDTKYHNRFDASGRIVRSAVYFKTHRNAGFTIMKAIICEYHSWNSIYRIGNHHYAREFMSNGWEVLWVSHPVSWLHGLKPGNLQRMKISSSPPFHHPDGPMEFIPRTVLPFLNTAILNSQWVLKNTLNHCSPSIGRVLESS